jgi:glycine/D-amino acid oxidase-like deaminating enzyme
MSRTPVDGGRSVSYWAEHERVPTFAPLAGDVEADVCVIGGGVAGLSVAYELACDGRRVVVLEDGEIGAGETARTTAHLSNAFDDSYVALEEIVGVDRARVVAASHTWAIDRIEAIVRAEEIDCDFRRVDGFLSLAAGDDPRRLHDELAAAHRAGLTDVAWVDAVPLLVHGVGRAQPALRFPA